MKSAKYQSLFIKLLKIYGLSFILILLLSFASFRFFNPRSVERLLYKNFQNYSQLIARDLGSPPNIELLKKYSEEFKLKIYIWNDSELWSVEADALEKTKNLIPLKLLKRQFYFESEGKKYLFEASTLKDVQNSLSYLPFVIILIGSALILYLSYRRVKNLFKPIDDIEDFTKQLSAGVFEKRLAERSEKDQFSQLALDLNQMATKIQSYMTQARDLSIAVSHELRSPLTRMRVAIEMTSDQKLKNMLEEEIKALDSLTEILLQKERIDRGLYHVEKKEIDLNNFLSDLVKTYSDRIQLKMPSEIISLKADPELLKIALRNLIENSLRFSENLSPLELEAFKTSGNIRISLRDYGPGMDAEKLKKLQNSSSYQISGEKSQFGLGIGLVKSIALAHNAELKMENAEPGLKCQLLFSETL